MPYTRTDTALLLLRAVLGVTFVVHGLEKLGDLGATRDYFASLAIPAPALMAPLVAITETLGGVLLIVGLATSLAAVALAVNMAVALAVQHAPNGFLVANGGYEFVLLLGLASVAVALAGPGRLSLDGALSLPARASSRLRAATSR